MNVVRLSALSTERLYRQEVFLVLISVRGWVDPMAVVRPEGLSQWKMPMTLSGMEPANFLLVAHFLIQQRHRFPPNMYVPGSLSQVCTVSLSLPSSVPQLPWLHCPDCSKWPVCRTFFKINVRDQKKLLLIQFRNSPEIKHCKIYLFEHGILSSDDRKLGRSSQKANSAISSLDFLTTGLLCSLCSVGRKPLGAVRCTNFTLLLFSFRAMCSENDGTRLKAHRHVQSRLAPVICLVSLS